MRTEEFKIFVEALEVSVGPYSFERISGRYPHPMRICDSRDDVVGSADTKKAAESAVRLLNQKIDS